MAWLRRTEKKTEKMNWILRKLGQELSNKKLLDSKFSGARSRWSVMKSCTATFKALHSEKLLSSIDLNWEKISHGTLPFSDTLCQPPNEYFITLVEYRTNVLLLALCIFQTGCTKNARPLKKLRESGKDKDLDSSASSKDGFLRGNIVENVETLLKEQMKLRKNWYKIEQSWD